MTQPADRTVASIRAAHLQTVEATRAIAAQAITTVARALYAAAATVFVLMVLVYVGAAMESGTSDWPGEHWFAVVPLVVAGVTLHLGGARLARPSSPEGIVDQQ